MRSYNPLDVDELGRNAARALMAYPPSELPPAGSFEGAGVYTLYYHGSFPAYADIDADVPIYVGKADPKGKRHGRGATKRTGTVLYRRLSEHAASIESVENLALGDFRCRWLVLDPVWTDLTEQVLISKYRPVWNAKVGGFGSHHQGTARTTQQRSRWDTLHPGRSWAVHQRANKDSAGTILEEIAAWITA